jgi:hypothetical protein
MMEGLLLSSPPSSSLPRRHKEREAVILADNGLAPPLCPRQPLRAERSAGPEYGATYGTECLEPGSLRKWKAAAVMRMLERKVRGPGAEEG